MATKGKQLTLFDCGTSGGKRIFSEHDYCKLTVHAMIH